MDLSRKRKKVLTLHFQFLQKRLFFMRLLRFFEFYLFSDFPHSLSVFRVPVCPPPPQSLWEIMSDLTFQKVALKLLLLDYSLY